MFRTIEPAKRAPFRYDPSQRGFHAVYHPGEVNHCPACGRTHWYVGRLSAECGFCAAALALADTGMTGSGLFLRGQRLDEAA
jgi:hypothetical protein